MNKLPEHTNNPKAMAFAEQLKKMAFSNSSHLFTMTKNMQVLSTRIGKSAWISIEMTFLYASAMIKYSSTSTSALVLRR